ncbi:hypothetical protein WMY93_025200 [Mugilogobius chulae]|uniref:Uncharacterized protein n=1 Tax=Mugilogobius chulae TaxID=88201 RepID=A0AAW0NC94_9GOBI
MVIVERMALSTSKTTVVHPSYMDLTVMMLRLDLSVMMLRLDLSVMMLRLDLSVMMLRLDLSVMMLRLDLSVMMLRLDLSVMVHQSSSAPPGPDCDSSPKFTCSVWTRQNGSQEITGASWI